MPCWRFQALYKIREPFTILPFSLVLSPSHGHWQSLLLNGCQLMSHCILVSIINSQYAVIRRQLSDILSFKDIKYVTEPFMSSIPSYSTFRIITYSAVSMWVSVFIAVVFKQSNRILTGIKTTATINATFQGGPSKTLFLANLCSLYR